MELFLVLLMLISAGAVAGVTAILNVRMGVPLAAGLPGVVVWTTLAYFLHPAAGVSLTVLQLVNWYLTVKKLGYNIA